MAKCDMCGGHFPASKMDPLRGIYSGGEVIDVCESCSEMCDVKLSELQKDSTERMREFVRQQVGLPRKRGGFWQRAWRKIFGG